VKEAIAVAVVLAQSVVLFYSDKLAFSARALQLGNLYL